MEQKVLTVAVAVVIIVLCASRVSAQEILNVKADSFHKLNVQKIENELGLEELNALAVTLLPYPNAGTLFLDGQPLKSGKLLTPEEASRVWIFTTSTCGAVPVGITVFPDPPADNRLKIRCINRKISPIIQLNQPTNKEE